MGARLTWTPLGEAAAVYVDLSSFGLQRLGSLQTADASQSRTPAGLAVVVVHDLWDEYELHVDAVDMVADVGTFLQLLSFQAHAAVGAEFAFAVESTDMFNAATTSNKAQGATSLDVASTTGLSAGDLIMIEDVLDPRRQSAYVTGPPTATAFSISPALHHSYQSGSIVRHLEYFPHCRSRPGEVIFQERDAGLGANLWDLRARFRSFRG